MNYLAVLGRQPEISIAELESLFSDVEKISPELAIFNSENLPNIDLFGGSLKFAIKLDQKPLDFLQNSPAGKITFGLSDYSRSANKNSATHEALKLKKILTRHGRSVRVVENRAAALSTATALHNGLSGKNDRKIELIKTDRGWFRTIGIQNIDAYTRRDQARPARDARVGMLPPKLAQILINLCGPLEKPATLLDPFCGTGVVLQEALLMGFQVCGTDIDERMVKYSEKNLNWLLGDLEIVDLEGIRRLASRGKAPATRGDGLAGRGPKDDNLQVIPNVIQIKSEKPENTSLRTRSRALAQAYGPQESISRVFQISQGDATTCKWPHIDAVACEGYLGRPFSKIPTEIELKTEQQNCQNIILGFLKNLSSQISENTPVVIAIPAWLRSDHTFKRLKILDEIEKLGYNVSNKSREGLLYHREDQIVARDIIILRKK